MERNILKAKSFVFAVRIVRLFQFLQTAKKEYVIAKQLLRCGTSVGSMVREAEHAESKADFIHKMAVAQKEINETIYWLELLAATDYLTPEQAASLCIDATELLKLLTSSIKTAKNNLKTIGS
ncbi:four helix bundle protein [Hymenobacter antarcticus]|uniref:Four helix bundle protein n=1 Tax=Hymenobacter antarcticus TaxID=486270 RepID=A0ABP7QA95_9BACT